MNTNHINSFISNSISEREEGHFLGSVFPSGDLTHLLHMKQAEDTPIEVDSREVWDDSLHQEEFMFI